MRKAQREEQTYRCCRCGDPIKTRIEARREIAEAWKRKMSGRLI